MAIVGDTIGGPKVPRTSDGPQSGDGRDKGGWDNRRMTILPIRITGDPVLHRRAEEVTEFDSSLTDLAHDMVDTMAAAPGVGLAGPQVGVGLRLFVWGYAGGARFDARYDDEGGTVVTEGIEGTGLRGVVVNPQLLVTPVPVRTPDQTYESEGCLSVPGHQFPLVRAERAVLTGLDPTGAPLRVEARGWLARIFQHEYDHLDGTLYVDRLAEPWAPWARDVVRGSGWGVPGRSWTPEGE